ncbi:MAG: tetratricopeptide repeat protein, partial [Rikenellaceae bacterium]
MRILRLILTIIIVVQISALSARSPHLDRAEDLYKAGRWADTRYELLQARGDIDKFDKKSQERIDVLLALCSVKLGDNESELWLERFEQRYPRSIYNNKVKLSRAMLYTARCDYAKAQECFEDVNYEALTPSEREKLDVRLGYIYFIHGDYDRARPIFKRVSDSSELYDHALYYLSYINYISNDKSKAKEGFGLLSGSDTYGTLAPYYILQVEFQEGNYKYVIEKGSELMDGTSQSWKVDLARTIAEACFQEEEFARAMDLLVQFKKGGGEIGRDERYIMGFSLYRTARYKEAIDELKQVVGAEDTMTQNASYHLADSYLKVGDKRGAMQAFALASNGNYNEAIKEDALFNYGKLLYELSGSGFDATINILTRYINEYPNSSRNEEAKTILISAYYNSHHYDAAYKAIKEIKHPDADIRAALQKIAYFRGIEAYKAGDYKLAESCLKEAATINISPKYSSLSQFWRGEIAYRKGAYSQALDKYRSFLMLAPKSDPTYKLAQYNSGYTLLMQGEHDGALNCFKLFTELESQQTPLLTDAQNRVGDLLYEKRQFSSASQSYKSAAAASDDGAHYAR